MAQYRIGSIQKACVVLRVVVQAGRPATLTEIVRTTGFTKTNVFNILKTYEEVGFVSQVKDGWVIGRGLWSMIREDMETTLAQIKLIRGGKQ